MATELPFKLKNPELFHNNSYVHGAWVEARSGKRFEIIDPGSDRVFTSCPDNGPDDVEAAVVSSHNGFKSFRTLSPRRRAQLLTAWHTLIMQAKDDLAQILTYETGKPLAESYGELDYSLGFTWWFAGEAERIQGSITFAAGCAMVVKPSQETPLTCLALAHLATRAGLPGAEEGTTMGPLTTTPRSLEKATAQVEDAIRKGAKLVLGDGQAHRNATFTEGSGKGASVGGYFMSPTILTGMSEHMILSQEETFAPVCGVFQFETEEENLEAGMIGLNTGNASAAESPFGGIKESGYGKESGKDVAVREYLIEKTGTLTVKDDEWECPCVLA
ncbi:Aldehyde/histidinol dehydrogenase [Ilyonectria sp. MPI-CAGE-AT-0026]|nr:Aldehyde/histidinol dehydrogenase [Ilyonectria sp. MPI-CAGE-AT-0026]